MRFEPFWLYFYSIPNFHFQMSCAMMLPLILVHFKCHWLISCQVDSNFEFKKSLNICSSFLFNSFFVQFLHLFMENKSIMENSTASASRLPSNSCLDRISEAVDSINHNIIARDYFKLLAKDKSVMSEAALELHNFMLTVLKMKLAEKLRLNDE